MISWNEELKKDWISQQSCSSVFGDSNIFLCKQVLDGMYTIHFIFKIADMNRTLEKLIVGTLIFCAKSGNCAVKRLV